MVVRMYPYERDTIVSVCYLNRGWVLFTYNFVIIPVSKEEQSTVFVIVPFGFIVVFVFIEHRLHV